MANWKRSLAGVPFGLIAAGVLSGCSVEDPATHEAISIDVAADGRVHAERKSGARNVVVDAESCDALRRDHPEFLDALRAIRVDYRFSWSLTTVVERD